MVCLDCFDIIEIGLPVLYNSILVRRDKPVFSMRVLCSSNSRIMRLQPGISGFPHLVNRTTITDLHYGLKIESHTIP